MMFILGDLLAFLPMSALFRYAVIPFGASYFLKEIDFGGKNPLFYLKTVLTYAIRPKKTYLGNRVIDKRVHYLKKEITIVERRADNAAD